jgi:acetyltransferase-like isoleucine patch superfamily enzyme
MMKKHDLLMTLNDITFLFVIRFILYAVGALPFALAVYYTMFHTRSALEAAIEIALGAILSPLCLVLTTSFLCAVIPKPQPGIYPFFSWEAYRVLQLEEIHEIIASSTFLNNYVNRLIPVRWLVFKCLGLRTYGRVIIAPNVVLYDPYLILLAENAFLGGGALLSGHTIRNGRWIVNRMEVGANVQIGAFSRLVGATIGDGSHIDHSVSIMEHCKIGKNVTILHSTSIEPDAMIGDDSWIGRCCSVGAASKVGRDCALGDHVVLADYAEVADGVVIPDCTVVRGGGAHNRITDRGKSPNGITR